MGYSNDTFLNISQENTALQALGDKRTPKMAQFRVAEIETGGQKKEDPTVIPSSKA